MLFTIYIYILYTVTIYTPLNKELVRLVFFAGKSVYCDGIHIMIFTIYILYTVTVYATMTKRVSHMPPCYLYIATVLVDLTLYLEDRLVTK